MIDIVVCMFYVVSELVFGGVDSSGYIYSYKIGLEGGFIYFNWQFFYGFVFCYVSISNDG